MEKKLVFLFILIFYQSFFYSQIGIGTSDPHPESSLHIVSDKNNSVLLPTVDHISSAADPGNDPDFAGAVVYEKQSGTIYEHDGTQWSSIYNFEINLKSKYMAHFTRLNRDLSCTRPLAVPSCEDSGILSWTDNGSNDFKGDSINIALNGSDNIKISEAGVYRITFRTYARRSGANTENIYTYLQRSTDSGTHWNTLTEASYNKSEDNAGFKPILSGNIVIQLNPGDLLRIEARMTAGYHLINHTSNAHFEDKTAYGIGELIIEKIII